MTIHIENDIIHVSMNTNKEPVRTALLTLPKPVVKALHEDVEDVTVIQFAEIPRTTGYKYVTDRIIEQMTYMLDVSITRSLFNMHLRTAIATITAIALAVISMNVTILCLLGVISATLIGMNVAQCYEKINKWKSAVNTIRYHFWEEYVYYLYGESEIKNKTINGLNTTVSSHSKEIEFNQLKLKQLRERVTLADNEISRLNTQRISMNALLTQHKKIDDINTKLIKEHKGAVEELESSQRALVGAYNDILNSVSPVEVDTHIARCKTMGISLNIERYDGSADPMFIAPTNHIQ